MMESNEFSTDLGKALMTVEIQLSPQDLMAFQAWGLRERCPYGRSLARFRALITWRWVIPIALIAGGAFVLWAIGSPPSQIVFFGKVCACAVAAIVLILAVLAAVQLLGLLLYHVSAEFRLRAYRRQLLTSPDPVLDGPTHFSLADEGVVYEGTLSGGWMRWRQFLKVVETREHIFLMFHEWVAFIFPKRAFPDSASASRWCDVLRTHIEHTAEGA